MLIVEDNQDAADSLAVLLKLWGYLMAVAYSGEQALEAARAAPPRVVLLDIGLPGIDACETARRLREAAAAPPELVALTGFGQDDERRRCRAAGVAHYLVKPVDLAELRRLLTRLSAAV